MSEAPAFNPFPAPAKAADPIVMGLVPCYNRYFLDPIWPVIQPGVAEVAQECNGEFEVQEVWRGIFTGQYQLYVAHIDRGAPAPVSPEKFQEVFLTKLRAPDQGFAGFFTLDVFRPKGVIHLHIAYIMPAFRDGNLLQVGMEYIFSQVPKVGGKYLTMSVPVHRAPIYQKFGFERGWTWDDGRMDMRKRI